MNADPYLIWEVLAHLWDLYLGPPGTLASEDIPRAIAACLVEPRTRPPEWETLLPEAMILALTLTLTITITITITKTLTL